MREGEQGEGSRSTGRGWGGRRVRSDDATRSESPMCSLALERQVEIARVSCHCVCHSLG